MSHTVTVTTPLGSSFNWQDVPRGETGGVLVGDIPETILPLVIERLEQISYPERGGIPDTKTMFALTYLKQAQKLLLERRADREERGVSGTRAL